MDLCSGGSLLDGISAIVQHNWIAVTQGFETFVLGGPITYYEVNHFSGPHVLLCQLIVSFNSHIADHFLSVSDIIKGEAVGSDVVQHTAQGTQSFKAPRIGL